MIGIPWTLTIKRFLQGILDTWGKVCFNAEMECKSTFPDHCRATLAEKKILLFRDLLVEAEHTDLDIRTSYNT